MVKVFFAREILNISQGDQSKKLNLKHEIGDVLCRGERIFVRFKAVGYKTPERNIICLGVDGKMLWQVQDPDQWRTGQKYSNADIYVGMGFDDSGSLWVAGGQSRYRIDMVTGKILEEVYTK